jgi:5-methylcytosine-specific restriction endonuclease McrA
MAREPITRAIQAAIYLRDRWLCRYCGVEILFSPALKVLDTLCPGHAYYSQHGSGATMAKLLLDRCACIDHVRCVKHLGDNAPENLVAACWSCNLRKSTSDDSSWCERLIPISALAPSPGWDGLVGVIRKLEPTNSWLRLFPQ